MRCAIYARVSTPGQEPENQLQELRQYVAARTWTGTEYVDRGVSGAKDRRPALDQLLADARRRKIDVLLCWRLDRLGRNLRHLVTLLDEMQAVGVAFVSLNEGIDTGTPAGRLQLQSWRRWRNSSGNAFENGWWRACSGPERKASVWADLGSIEPRSRCQVVLCGRRR